MVTADTEMEAVKGKQGVGALKNTFYLVNCVPAGMDARSPSSRMRDAGESVTAAGFFPPDSFYDKGPTLVSETPTEIPSVARAGETSTAGKWQDTETFTAWGWVIPGASMACLESSAEGRTTTARDFMSEGAWKGIPRAVV